MMDAVESDSLSTSAPAPLAPAAASARSRGLTTFFVYGGLYAASLIGAIAPIPYATNVLFAVLNGVFIAMLFIIGHDCGHGSLVPGRRLNLWLGRVAFIPIGHSISLWRLAHNGHHHRRVNLKGVDPVWAPMSVADYRKASAPRRLLERFHRSAFGPLIYYYSGIWLPWMLLPLPAVARTRWRRHVTDSAIAILGLAGTIVGIGALGHWIAPARPLWLVLVLGWALPFAVWNYVAGLSFYLNHTHPRIPWFDNEKAWRAHGNGLGGTAHLELPLDLLPLYSDAMSHIAHHVDPLAPFHELPGRQRALAAEHAGELIDYSFSFAEYRRILRACKLFDFERMCWTDFAGNPTTPRLISDAG
jgi:omega-6 fatty acid desaturase (delta-12 desaturase)